MFSYSEVLEQLKRLVKLKELRVPRRGLPRGGAAEEWQSEQALTEGCRRRNIRVWFGDDEGTRAFTREGWE